MRLIHAADVQRLTGLTSDQLREWTVRRKLISPDELPHGPGSRARYSWQTTLLLRLAVVLKEAFHIELKSQQALFGRLASRFSGLSFPALRDITLVIRAGGEFELLESYELARPLGDALVLSLNPHLDVLALGFGDHEPIRQMNLFPVIAVR